MNYYFVSKMNVVYWEGQINYIFKKLENEEQSDSERLRAYDMMD